MKAIGMTQFGGPEVLQVFDLPEAEPGYGEIVIGVRAAAVNPTDITFRTGGRAAALASRPGPYVPGMDVSGVVDKVGPGTDGRLRVGDPVIAYVNPFTPHGGAYAEQLVVAQSSVVPAPAKASFAEASTLLLNAVTARLSLDALALRPGRTVVIVGAAGAVGGFAVEMAKTEGLTVLAYASDADEALLRGLGADDVVPRRKDAASDVRNVLPEGADALIDGAALNERVLGAVADGGALASLKGWTGPTERGIRIQPVSSTSAAGDTALLNKLARQAESGELSLRVGDLLPASRAAEAHRRLVDGGVRGRLVLDFANPGW
ncbi:NADP-dependent oxidoreductase [Streptomyces sp. NPDC093228]|uniref:NADP-dependent oxidoreductase n=1 Tax=Streptomyces sp. NPDC093228 TaxID=3155070 RepID=UPI003445D117